jgi:hypothetical protein
MQITPPPPIKTPCKCPCRHALRRINVMFPQCISEHKFDTTFSCVPPYVASLDEINAILHYIDCEPDYLPTINHINMLMACSCCVRHQQYKIQSIKSSNKCECECRHMVRRLCEACPQFSHDYPSSIETAVYQPMSQSTHVKLVNLTNNWIEASEYEYICFGRYLNSIIQDDYEMLKELFDEVWNCRCCERHQTNKIINTYYE